MTETLTVSVAAGGLLRRNKQEPRWPSRMRGLRRTAKGLKNAGDDQISCQNAECHGSYHREGEHYRYKKCVHVIHP